ncbi:MAG TPA: hypothetical protein VFW10_12820 [Steroidobacteraceae bacterium]|nr:hypothetical protein [Steroidobacteraceae bacterium]
MAESPMTFKFSLAALTCDIDRPAVSEERCCNIHPPTTSRKVLA